jgi:hypothetical protein
MAGNFTLSVAERGAKSMIVADTDIPLGEKDAGEMRTAADGKGLALLRLEQLERALSGDGVLKAGDATLTPRKPDWATF